MEFITNEKHLPLYISQGLQKGTASQLKTSYRTEGFLSIKRKNKQDLAYFENKSLWQLIEYYQDKPFTKERMRKILKKRLFCYENVGFSNRKGLWFLCSDAKIAQDFAIKDYYTILRDNFKNMPPKNEELIELDLIRTAHEPAEPTLRELHQEKLKKCANVLKTYVKRNPDLGYCQGLNYIVWELILRFDEVNIIIFSFSKVLGKFFDNFGFLGVF